MVEKPFGCHTSPAFRVRDKMFAVEVGEIICASYAMTAPKRLVTQMGERPGAMTTGASARHGPAQPDPSAACLMR